MNAIWKRLDEPGKHWRHVYKVRVVTSSSSFLLRAKYHIVVHCDQALILLEYLIKNGSEGVAAEAKVHLLQIKTLKEFQYFDEDRKDCGQSGSRRRKFVFVKRTHTHAHARAHIAHTQRTYTHIYQIK